MSEADKNPLITIVTLTYNKFERIYDTISSVLMQDYPNIEYIICDDGSKSFPKIEIEDYINNNNKGNVYYKVIVNEFNQGTVKNINIAYKEGGGDYYINLSCEDVFFSSSVVSEIYKRFCDTDAEVICTTRIAYYPNGEPTHFIPHLSEQKQIEQLDSKEKQYKALLLGEFYELASGSVLSVSGETIRRMNYFDENYILLEDMPFFAKYLQVNKIIVALDIISIWYSLDGVTSDDREHRNPLLVADLDRFYSTDARIWLKDLSKSDQRKYEFMTKYRKCVSRRDKLKVVLTKIPEYIHYRRFAAARNKAKEEDKILIKEMDINQLPTREI